MIYQLNDYQLNNYTILSISTRRIGLLIRVSRFLLISLRFPDSDHNPKLFSSIIFPKSVFLSVAAITGIFNSKYESSLEGKLEW